MIQSDPRKIKSWLVQYYLTQKSMLLLIKAAIKLTKSVTKNIYNVINDFYF